MFWSQENTAEVLFFACYWYKLKTFMVFTGGRKGRERKENKRDNTPATPSGQYFCAKTNVLIILCRYILNPRLCLDYSAPARLIKCPEFPSAASPLPDIVIMLSEPWDPTTDEISLQWPKSPRFMHPWVFIIVFWFDHDYWNRVKWDYVMSRVLTASI